MNGNLSARVVVVAVFICCILAWIPAQAESQTQKVVNLAEPSKTGGLSVMEAFAKRASVLSWNPGELSSQNLSDLLWAANGINEEKLRPLLNLKDSQAMLLRHPVGYLTDAN